MKVSVNSESIDWSVFSFVDGSDEETDGAWKSVATFKWSVKDVETNKAKVDALTKQKKPLPSPAPTPTTSPTGARMRTRNILSRPRPAQSQRPFSLRLGRGSLRCKRRSRGNQRLEPKYCLSINLKPRFSYLETSD